MSHRQGPESKNVVKTPVKTGAGSKGISPGWVNQRGNLIGDHATTPDGRSATGYRGEQKFTDQNFQPVKFGNELATNVGKGGPGAGRTLYGQSGQQGCHGTPAPGNAPAKSTDILRQFGPDYRK